MKISEDGMCVQASECMPTKFNPIFRKESRKISQKEYINKYNCFLSGGRLYVKLQSLIVDAVTGTLFKMSGHCLSDDADLVIDVNNNVTDKESILQFIWSKY